MKFLLLLLVSLSINAQNKPGGSQDDFTAFIKAEPIISERMVANFASCQSKVISPKNILETYKLLYSELVLKQMSSSLQDISAIPLCDYNTVTCILKDGLAHDLKLFTTGNAAKYLLLTYGNPEFTEEDANQMVSFFKTITENYKDDK